MERFGEGLCKVFRLGVVLVCDRHRSADISSAIGSGVSHFQQRAVAVLTTGLTVMLSMLFAFHAQAGYVGESFLQVPGVTGGWQGKHYQGWVKLEAREWVETSACKRQPGNPFVCDGQMWKPKESRQFMSAPWAPETGAGVLAVALDKKRDSYSQLMQLCRQGQVIPEMVYAESAQLSRRIGEVGRPPEQVPEYFEYSLRGVTLSCPDVPAAQEQALIVAFDNIAWRNYQPGEGVAAANGRIDTTAEPATLQPLPASGESKTFLLTWIQLKGATQEGDCPQMNREPGMDEYFALRDPKTIAKDKAELIAQGGLATLGEGIAFRGPEGLDVCALPGIVADPGHAIPDTDTVIGFNLDDFDGKGVAPAETHLHQNFVSEDGREGIDNQLYVVEGCVPGFRPGGNIPKVANEMMRNGSVTLLLNISGIDDITQDDDVVVSVLFSKDLMVKTADGADIQPDYTFRLSDNPEFTQFAAQFKGRIENGVVTTEQLAELTWQEGGQNAFKLRDAMMRVELLPDNRIKGVVGGYLDWRLRMTNWGRNRILEPTMRFQCPGLYNAYKRAADGYWDEQAGEYRGISAAYEIEGVTAFIPVTELTGLMQSGAGQ